MAEDQEPNARDIAIEAVKARYAPPKIEVQEMTLEGNVLHVSLLVPCVFRALIEVEDE